MEAVLKATKCVEPVHLHAFFTTAKRTRKLVLSVGSIPVALSCPVYVPHRGRAQGSYPEPRLVIELRLSVASFTVRILTTSQFC